MNSNFNRQFLLLDFALLDDGEFLEFTRRAAFATYLLLRRYVWRSQQPHALGLHNLYWQERQLAASVSTRLLADKLRLTDRTRVSKHLAFLEEERIIKTRRTGRESIYLLGEWIDYGEVENGSKRLEWFYIDRRFGVETANFSDGLKHKNSDVAMNAKSDVPKYEIADVASNAKSDVPKHGRSDVATIAKSDVPTWRQPPSQSWLPTPSNNREENREQNVNVDQGKSPLNQLPETGIDTDHADLIVDDLVGQLGDRQSARFYRLVARRVPESVIRQTLAEVRQSEGVQNPAALFNHKLRQYADQRLQESTKSRIDDLKQGIG